MADGVEKAVERAHPYAVLLAPGERLGWVFRDRTLFTRPFSEPAPVPDPVPAHVVDAASTARGKLARRLVAVIGVGLALAALFACCGGLATSVRVADLGAGFGVLAVFMVLATAGAATAIVIQHNGATARPERVREESQRRYTQALAAWQARRAAFEAAEQQRVDTLLEWGAARTAPGTRRLDVVGGNLWGWEALLSVFGASMLATPGPLTLVDLSGEAVCRELVHLAVSTNVSVDLQLLPTDLADSDLLVGLDPRQVVDVLVESMHGDADAAGRAERATDDRILSVVVDALGEEASLARVVAALRVLMGEPGDTPELTVAERAHIADDLFSDAYRTQAHAHLRRIEAHLHPLRELGARRQPRPRANLTCLAMATDGRSARTDLLTDLTGPTVTDRSLAAAVRGPGGPGPGCHPLWPPGPGAGRYSRSLPTAASTPASVASWPCCSPHGQHDHAPERSWSQNTSRVARVHATMSAPTVTSWSLGGVSWMARPSPVTASAACRRSIAGTPLCQG